MSLPTLYAGKVSHVRHTPFVHRFAYRIWMLRADLDRLDEIAGTARYFAHNRFALTAFHDKDHGRRDGSPLRAYVESALARDGLGEFAAGIEFLAMPRVLGYGFNPISFYFCYDTNGTLGAVLHQVKNTFGDQIGYLMPVERACGTLRHRVGKTMHVSPFFDMQGGYRFALTPPAERFSVSIEYGAQEKRLTATMALRAIPFSDAALLRLCLQMPFTSLKVVGAIHFQALRLLARGAGFHAVPKHAHAEIVRGSSE